MGLLDDIMKTLDRIPVWKRLQIIPKEVDELRNRVAELEEKLGAKWPPDVCKFCGARAARLTGNLGPNTNTKGKLYQRWECGDCGNVERRLA